MSDQHAEKARELEAKRLRLQAEVARLKQVQKEMTGTDESVATKDEEMLGMHRVIESLRAEVSRLTEQRRDMARDHQEAARIWQIERARLRTALEKCHEEIVGHLWHEGGDLEAALKAADAALAAQAPGDFLDRKLPGSHAGCNYLAGPDAVCNKCGKYVPAEPAQAPGERPTRELPAAVADALEAVAEAAEQVLQPVNTALGEFDLRELRRAMAELRRSGWRSG